MLNIPKGANVEDHLPHYARTADSSRARRPSVSMGSMSMSQLGSLSRDSEQESEKKEGKKRALGDEGPSGSASKRRKAGNNGVGAIIVDDDEVEAMSSDSGSESDYGPRRFQSGPKSHDNARSGVKGKGDGSEDGEIVEDVLGKGNGVQADPRNRFESVSHDEDELEEGQIVHDSSEEGEESRYGLSSVKSKAQSKKKAKAVNAANAIAIDGSDSDDSIVPINTPPRPASQTRRQRKKSREQVDAKKAFWAAKGSVIEVVDSDE